MDIRSLLISILLFSGVITGVSIFIADVTDDYGIATENITILSQADAIANQTVVLQNSFSTKITGIVAVDSLINTIGGFIEFINLTGTILFGFWSGLLSSVSTYLFIPTWALVIIGAIIIIFILFEIISAIIKWRV